MAPKQTYLISHTNPDGKTGIASCEIKAASESDARAEFRRLYPKRELGTVGIRGVGR